MTPELEKQLAKTIVQHLGAHPEVPVEVAARLKFAREQALLNRKQNDVVVYSGTSLVMAPV